MHAHVRAGAERAADATHVQYIYKKVMFRRVLYQLDSIYVLYSDNRCDYDMG
jgi:hypothetical protein